MWCEERRGRRTFLCMSCFVSTSVSHGPWCPWLQTRPCRGPVGVTGTPDRTGGPLVDAPCCMRNVLFVRGPTVPRSSSRSFGSQVRVTLGRLVLLLGVGTRGSVLSTSPRTLRRTALLRLRVRGPSARPPFYVDQGSDADVEVSG